VFKLYDTRLMVAILKIIKYIFLFRVQTFIIDDYRSKLLKNEVEKRFIIKLLRGRIK